MKKSDSPVTSNRKRYRAVWDVILGQLPQFRRERLWGAL
jgi:hypothetical protein